MQNCRLGSRKLTCADTRGASRVTGTTRICRDHVGTLTFRYTASGYTYPVGTTIRVDERGRLDRPR